MPPVFQPEEPKEFFTPFGPLLGYYRMSDSFVEQMNEAMSSRLSDYSAALVGKVREELGFDEYIQNLAVAELGQMMIEYHARARKRGMFGDYDPKTQQFALDVNAAWFVRQFEHEYNPLHIHTGCALSCVGYLKLPEGIEEEWSADNKANHPTHGHLQFAHGTDTHYSVSNFSVRPRIGDFYIFPSYMFHCVYPFSTPGERRSFSMNVSINET